MKIKEKLDELDENQKIAVIVVVFIVIWIMLDFINSTTETTDEPLKVKIFDTYLCKKTLDGFEAESRFSVGQKVYLCTTVEFSQVGKSTHVEIRLFRDEIKKPNEYYWYNIITLDEGRKAIPLEIDLMPRHYCLRLLLPRRMPFEGCFDVIGN